MSPFPTISRISESFTDISPVGLRVFGLILAVWLFQRGLRFCDRLQDREKKHQASNTFQTKGEPKSFPPKPFEPRPHGGALKTAQGAGCQNSATPVTQQKPLRLQGGLPQKAYLRFLTHGLIAALVFIKVLKISDQLAGPGFMVFLRSLQV